MFMRQWYRGLLWAILILFLGGILGTVNPQRVSAQSLWDKNKSGSLFADRKALKVGDLVTIIIVERTQASSSAQTTTGAKTNVGIGPGGGLLNFIPLVKVDGSDTFDSGGTTTRGGSLSAKLTAVVKEVQPNGILRIEGRQTIVVNGEEQEIVVSGLVRASDVSKDNTVMSTYVADATISYRGNGALGAKQEPGILTRILNWIF